MEIASARKKPDLFAIVALAVAAVVGVAMLLGVFRALTTDYEGQARAESCEDDYGYLLQIESFGHAAVDSHLWQDFRRECEQLSDLNAYLDARIIAREAGNVCIALDQQVGIELALMLESYGECDGVPLVDAYEATPEPLAEPAVEPAPQPVTAPPAAPVVPGWPGGSAISWQDSHSHAGTTQRVCGPLTSIRGDDAGVYLNLGRDYPDPERFTVIFWDVAWIDPIEAGAVICTTGTLIDYGGVMQIHTYPENVEIWE